jgi:hypothetical protein
MIVAITGSRVVSLQGREKIHRIMKEVVEDRNVKAIRFGGAEGSDTIALEAALLTRKGTKPKLTVLLPNRLSDQPTETHNITLRADEVIELGRHITSGDGFQSYHLRNDDLIHPANVVVAFWNGKDASGTLSVIRKAGKAQKKLRTVII